jgi:type 1 fimbria pilin
MKKMWLAVLGSAVLMLLSVGFSAAADMTYTGEIMDSACAKMGSHETMMKKEGIATAKDCTLGCVKAGSKFVLYNSAKKMTYQLDDQTKPMDFAGQKVKVMGTLDKATNTIHVTDIKGS